MPWLSSTGNRIWTCPDCRSVNVDADSEREWTCARCGQRWVRT